MKLQTHLFEDAPSGFSVRIYAFANALKMDLAREIWRRFKVSAFTEIPTEKELIRPLLVAEGERMRQVSDDYWIKRLSEMICNEMPDVAIVSDVRYENEANWIKKVHSGKIIRIKREGVTAANDVERQHNSTIDKYVDECLITKNGSWEYEPE